MSMVAQLKEWTKQWMARLVRYGFLARSEHTGFDQLEGALGSPVDPTYQHPVRRFQHYGFRSRPRVGAELICVAPRGGTSNRVSIASEVPGTGPSDQEEGEVEIYSEGGQRIVLLKGGGLTLLTKTGNQIELREDGSIFLQESLGGHIHFTGKIIHVDQTVESQHFQGRGLRPVVVPGLGLGGGSASLYGTDAGITLQLIVLRPTPGPLATILFANAYPAPPAGIGLCTLDAVTAKAMTMTPFYVLSSRASLQIMADGLLPGSYQLSLTVIG